ncbi:hypothetical protein [Halomarina ordinaria]|uniref:Uncharacterized protein n=1 Tax=Halomarina ordinaria TaxID=3033939 RepID=A0ABD5UF35_9EURY|nr:hypothetical protein [Halomarina sp. PSRA2]
MDISKRQVGKATIVAVGAFIVFGVVTALIPNPFYIRKVPRTPLDYLFLSLTSGLLGVYVAQRSNSVDQNDSRFAVLGSAGGFLAFGCPICNAFLLALFSSSALMTYLDPLRPVLGVVSVVLLGGLVYVRYSRTCRRCRAEDTTDEALSQGGEPSTHQ